MFLMYKYGYRMEYAATPVEDPSSMSVGYLDTKG